jgi:hypothetical protein
LSRGAEGVEQKREPRSLEVETHAPVTYVPREERGSNPVSSKPRGTIASAVSRFYQTMIRPAAAVALGATLLLGGCATARQGTLTGGLPIAHASVQIAPQPYDIQVDAADVRSAAGRMNTTIMSSATPAMAMITRNPHVDQTVYGNYKQNIIPEFSVSKDAKGKFVAIFLLPVSGHVGSTVREQQENARHYAEIDRHKIWIKYPDGSTKTLAENLDPKGELTYAIRLELELEPGKHEIIFSPLPEGRPELKCHDHSWPVDPSGFDVGRRQIYNVEAW